MADKKIPVIDGGRLIGPSGHDSWMASAPKMTPGGFREDVLPAWAQPGYRGDGPPLPVIPRTSPSGHDSWMAPAVNRDPAAPPATAPVGGADGLAAATAAADGLLAEVRGQVGAIDAQFNKDVAYLRDLFRFAEDPAEKALLADQLGELEAQRDTAKAAIGLAFQQAQGSIADRAEASFDRSQETKAAMSGITGQGIGALNEAAAAAAVDNAGLYGLGVNADGGPDVSGEASWLSHVGDAEGDLALALGQVSSDGMDFLSALLGQESAAREFESDQFITGRQADLRQAYQQAQIEKRFQQEMAMRDAVTAALGDTRDRQERARDREADIAMQLASIRASAAGRRAEEEVDPRAETLALAEAVLGFGPKAGGKVAEMIGRPDLIGLFPEPKPTGVAKWLPAIIGGLAALRGGK